MMMNGRLMRVLKQEQDAEHAGVVMKAMFTQWRENLHAVDGATGSEGVGYDTLMLENRPSVFYGCRGWA